MTFLSLDSLYIFSEVPRYDRNAIPRRESRRQPRADHAPRRYLGTDMIEEDQSHYP